MYNYSFYDENKLFSSILQELTKMDRINLNYSFIPSDVSSNRLQRHYKNIDSLWFSRVTGSSGAVYYFFGLKKEETLGRNEEIETKLRFKYDEEKSISNLIFRKDGDVSIVIDINDNDAIIRKLLVKNFRLIQIKKDPEYRYQVILGRNSSEVLKSIEKLIKLVKFKLNPDDKYPLIQKTIKRYRIKQESENKEKTPKHTIKQNIDNEKPTKQKSIFQKILPKVKNNFPLETPRQGQLETISEIVNAIENGYKYIILEAGTGTGKSAMAATLVNIYDDAFILTVTKQLQDQYVRDFGKLGFAPVKGRPNFICKRNDRLTCDKGDCILNNRNCPYNIRDFGHDNNKKAFHDLYWKSDVHCSYWQQKIDALNSKVVIANYKYALYDFNFSQHFKKRKLLIMDEAHNLEDNIVDFVCLKFKLDNLKRDLGLKISEFELQVLESSSHEKWLEFVSDIAFKYIIYHRKIINDAKDNNEDELFIKDLEKRLSLIDQDYERFVNYIKDNPQNWVCYYNKNLKEISFKPAMIDKYASDYLLNKGDICIFMSATILDYEKFAFELGIDVSKIKFIHKDSPFDSSRNPIYSDKAVNMKSRHIKENAYDALDILKDILNKHKYEKGLVHVVSNECRDFIMNHLDNSRLMTHTTENRDIKLQEFKKTRNNVMVSPSMEEGVDLPGDECRFQVMFKMPRLPWGDKRIQAKLEFEPDWYDYRTAIRLVQMFGRGIRSEDDYCKTYIVDDTFNSFLRKDSFKNKFIPEYMRDAVIENDLLSLLFIDQDVNNDDVHTQFNYVPSNTPKDKLKKYDSETLELSSKINEYKEYFKHREFFTEEIIRGIVHIADEFISEDMKIGLVALPSSTVKRDNNSSIRKSLKLIGDMHNQGIIESDYGCKNEIINCGWLLYRSKNVKNSHNCDGDERPTKREHLSTIECDKDKLNKFSDIVFILVDDITTKGTIMAACEEKLTQNGIYSMNIHKFALFKTVWWAYD